jgi:hypothetical protein
MAASTLLQDERFWASVNFDAFMSSTPPSQEK